MLFIALHFEKKNRQTTQYFPTQRKYVSVYPKGAKSFFLRNHCTYIYIVLKKKQIIEAFKKTKNLKKLFKDIVKQY